MPKEEQDLLQLLVIIVNNNAEVALPAKWSIISLLRDKLIEKKLVVRREDDSAFVERAI